MRFCGHDKLKNFKWNSLALCCVHEFYLAVEESFSLTFFTHCLPPTEIDQFLTFSCFNRIERQSQLDKLRKKMQHESRRSHKIDDDARSDHIKRAYFSEQRRKPDEGRVKFEVKNTLIEGFEFIQLPFPTDGVRSATIATVTESPQFFGVVSNRCGIDESCDMCCHVIIKYLRNLVWAVYTKDHERVTIATAWRLDEEKKADEEVFNFVATWKSDNFQFYILAFNCR